MTRSGGKLGQNRYTYPGLLGEKFKKTGMPNVQVINLGGNRYGLSQEYNLWKMISRSHDLDYVILTIHDIPFDRDLSFKHPFAHGPIHARYILQDNKLKQISVAGNNRDQACKIYNALLPPLRYLRYDRGMPMALRALLPESLHSRMNPFYYQWSRSEKEELLPIYAAIFREVASKAKHVIVLARDDWVRELRELVPLSNVSFLAPQAGASLSSFLYFNEHMDHPNAWGNRIVAEELFAYLTGRERWGFSAVKLSSLLQKDQKNNFTGPLSEYDDLSFKVRQKPVAAFFGDQAKPFSKKELRRGPSIKSFVLLPFTDALKVVFLPLPFSLKDQSDVFLVFSRNGKREKIPIGVIRSPSEILSEGVLRKDVAITVRYVSRESYDLFLEIQDQEFLSAIPPEVKSFSIMAGEKTIFQAHTFGEKGFGEGLFHKRSVLRLFLKAATFQWLYLRSPDSFAFEGDPFEQSGGTVDLVLTRKKGPEERCPIFSYELVPTEKTIAEPYKECIAPDSPLSDGGKIG